MQVLDRDVAHVWYARLLGYMGKDKRGKIINAAHVRLLETEGKLFKSQPGDTQSVETQPVKSPLAVVSDPKNLGKAFNPFGAVKTGIKYTENKDEAVLSPASPSSTLCLRGSREATD